MTCWVIRNGQLVDKSTALWLGDFYNDKRSSLPSPRVSRFDSMESPVTEKTISSWRERDRDMERAGAIDPRDIPKKLFDKRKELVKRNERSEPAA